MKDDVVAMEFWNSAIFQNIITLQQNLLQPNRQQVQLQTNRDMLLRADHQDGKNMLTQDNESVNYNVDDGSEDKSSLSENLDVTEKFCH